METQPQEELASAESSTDYDGKEEKASSEEMETMQKKTENLRDGEEAFGVLIVTNAEGVWEQLESFCHNFVTSQQALIKSGGNMGLVVLLPEDPPKHLVDALHATEEGIPLAFLNRKWRDPSSLAQV